MTPLFCTTPLATTIVLWAPATISFVSGWSIEQFGLREKVHNYIKGQIDAWTFSDKTEDKTIENAEKITPKESLQYGLEYIAIATSVALIATTIGLLAARFDMLYWNYLSFEKRYKAIETISLTLIDKGILLTKETDLKTNLSELRDAINNLRTTHLDLVKTVFIISIQLSLKGYLLGSAFAWTPKMLRNASRNP